MHRRILRGGTWFATLIAVTASCSPSADPAVIREPTFRGLQPYAYSRPVPAVTETVVDGSYVRVIPVREAGRPVACRRCAPYRLDAGRTVLFLERGRFFVVFTPAARRRHCPGCGRAGSFRSTGHFVVEGNEIEVFNDAVCTDTRGTYTWRRSADRLVLEPVKDPCFGGLRARFFSSEAWNDAASADGA